MTAGFDALAAAKDLQGAGMDQRQAEAIARAIRDGQGDLASKADLEATITKLERRLMLYGLTVAALLFAAIKYL